MLRSAVVALVPALVTTAVAGSVSRWVLIGTERAEQRAPRSWRLVVRKCIVLSRLSGQRMPPAGSRCVLPATARVATS